ncbi:MAG: hypothetical protein UT02_C0048G0012 [Parcubacteria group bacterium GW2011_GWC2_38_7]|nr:MAG: hypothetical protein UT02_C0048G0012 [Parcubacteria group bacterium GW2011_GWC2_38_7]
MQQITVNNAEELFARAGLTEKEAVALYLKYQLPLPEGFPPFDSRATESFIKRLEVLALRKIARLDGKKKL